MKYSWILFLVACGTQTTKNEGEIFLALPSHFAQFKTWRQVELPDTPAEPGVVHFAGKRTLFVLGEHDANETWPQGSIILKRAEFGDDPTKWEVHAMAKRGGGYNLNGAVDWEWFDIELNASGDFYRIKSRGVKGGESYGNIAPDAPGADCNTCHLAAKDFDYVQSTVLH